MRWFGPTWNAPINELEQMPVPVGATCAGYDCGVQFEAGDRGVGLPWMGARDDDCVRVDGEELPHLVYHLRCHVKGVVGPGALLDKVMASLE